MLGISSWDLTPFIDQCMLQVIEVMASPQIFDGIEIRTTHVFVRFPLLDNVNSVAWGTIVLENKVIPISQKMC